MMTQWLNSIILCVLVQLNLKGYNFLTQQYLLEKKLKASKIKTSEEFVTDGVHKVIPREEEEQIENLKVIEIFEQVLRVLIQQRKPLGQTKWAYQMEMLKALRLVCKTWKESVDRILKNDPAHLILCPDGNSSLLQFKRNFTPCSTIIMYNDAAKTNLDQFLGSLRNNMAEYPTFNPLFTGHLIVDVDTTLSAREVFTGDWQRFAEMIVDVLMTLGDYVLYFTLGLKTQFQSQLTHVVNVSLGAMLMRWLHLTPNLKSLAMDFGNYRCNKLQYHQHKVSLDQVPHLQHLETIQNSGGIVIHQLLKRNQQVSRLCLVGSTIQITKILDMDLEDLSEVALFFGECNKPVVWFGKLSCVPWQPRDLSLKYPTKIARSLHDAVRVLSPHLKNKLVRISLELLMSPIPNNSEVEWDLPSIKQIKIKWLSAVWFPINLRKLLKKVKLLETLELEVGKSNVQDITKLQKLGVDTSENGKEERIQGFWQFVDALGMEKYWSHLPKLRSVKIKLAIMEGQEMTIQQRDIVRSGMSTIAFQYIKIGNEDDYNGF